MRIDEIIANADRARLLVRVLPAQERRGRAEPAGHAGGSTGVRAGFRLGDLRRGRLDPGSHDRGHEVAQAGAGDRGDGPSELRGLEPRRAARDPRRDRGGRDRERPGAARRPAARRDGVDAAPARPSLLHRAGGPDPRRATRSASARRAFPRFTPRRPISPTTCASSRRRSTAGSSFLITNLFLDNELYFRFVEEARAAGIEVPIIPGIMPVTNAGQIKTMTGMCGASIPPALLEALEWRANDPEAVLQLGVAYATLQCAELLARGAPGIHFYTLNRSHATRAILSALKLLRPWVRREVVLGASREADLERVGDHRPPVDLVADVDLIVALVGADAPEADQPGSRTQLLAHQLALEQQLARRHPVVGAQLLAHAVDVDLERWPDARGAASRATVSLWLQIGRQQRQDGEIQPVAALADVGSQNAFLHQPGGPGGRDHRPVVGLGEQLQASQSAGFEQPPAGQPQRARWPDPAAGTPGRSRSRPRRAGDPSRPGGRRAVPGRCLSPARES